MNRFETASPFPTTALDTSERITAFLKVAYGWMCVGLLVTATVAWILNASPALLMSIARTPLLFWGLMLGQLGIVFYLSARVNRLSPSTAAGLFLGYSALTGITFAMILFAYTKESVATTFFVTAGMFGALALYGTTTRRSLAGMGQFLFMGLIGVVLASIVGIFWQNDGFQFVLSFIGVILFTGLTAYDAQRLKAMAVALPEGQTGSYAIVGALSLYLDFINLFLFLLRFLGGRRD
jgi:FtsH-binding integral membrane protein